MFVYIKDSKHGARNQSCKFAQNILNANIFLKASFPISITALQQRLHVDSVGVARVLAG
jgi:hypothetical protein